MQLSHHYDGLLELLDERKDEVFKFLHFLETQTNWLTSPASVSHHMNVPGGLLMHSLLVTRHLLDLRNLWARKYSNETCVIVGLLHDVGKIGTPDQPLYLARKSRDGGGQFHHNEELITMGMGVRSLYLCGKYLTLTDEEAQAICYHDGQYVPENLVVKNREQPLTLLLHFADMWSSHVTEREIELSGNGSAAKSRGVRPSKAANGKGNSPSGREGGKKSGSADKVAPTAKAHKSDKNKAAGRRNVSSHGGKGA